MNSYSIVPEVEGVIIGILEADSVRTAESGQDFINYIKEFTLHIASEKEEMDEKTKSAVRNMLRFGKYKPTGRGKPASEYLYNTTLKNGALPMILNIVDANNLMSAGSCFPISTFDRDKCMYPLVIRRGQPDESYIFNNSGQEIRLEDLLLVADREKPLGNPVKDRMETKVSEETANTVSVIYAPAEVCTESRMQEILDEFSEIMKKYCGATETRSIIVKDQS